MRGPTWKRAVRLAAATTALALVAVGAGAPGYATQEPKQLSGGTPELGFLTTPIYRGGVVPDEFLVVATPGNCGNHIQVTYTWNEAQNWMRVRLKGKNVLDPYPTITRTEGVDFFPKPFWPEQQSFTNGRYQFWTISASETVDFYYDNQTLELLGSEYDFATPPDPADVTTLNIPVLTALPTPYFQPDANGDVDLMFEYDYDNLVRPDEPQFAHTIATFVPQTLCKANPFRYDQTSTRPYSVTVPASKAKPFREYLENGLIWDVTIEPPTPFTYPPRPTLAGTYQGSTAVAGAVPKGWTLDLEAFFDGNAPPLIPFPSAPFAGEACTTYFKPKRDRSYDVCASQQGGAQ